MGSPGPFPSPSPVVLSSCCVGMATTKTVGHTNEKQLHPTKLNSRPDGASRITKLAVLADSTLGKTTNLTE